MAKGKINADKDECELVDHDANDNSSRWTEAQFVGVFP
jgi:hypothetical protein